MPELVTVDTIMDWMKERVENRDPLPPSLWLDASAKLNSLRQNLDEDLVTAEMEVNQLIAQGVESGESYSASKSIAKGSESYRTLLTLKAKKERLVEFIRIAKKRTDAPAWDQ